jgi:hypothetical protein
MLGSDVTSYRKRRGIFNFIGKISKVLFVTLDSDDADYYNDQIRGFENRVGIAGLIKKQLSIIKSSLGNLNEVKFTP